MREALIGFALAAGLVANTPASLISQTSGLAPTDILPGLGGRFGSATLREAPALVAGFAETADGEVHAFLWDGSALHDVGTLGGETSTPHALNGFGVVVGESKTTEGQQHAFRWSLDRGIEPLVDHSHYASRAVAIDARGRIVIVVQDAQDGPNRSYLVERGVTSDIGTLGGDWATAIAGSDDGRVVGISATPGGARRAFTWRDGRISALPSLGGRGITEPIAVNDRGEVVGGSVGRLGISEPVVWRLGQIQALPTPLSARTGAATGVAASGSIVGFVHYEPDAGIQARRDALLWTDDSFEIISVPNDGVGTMGFVGDELWFLGSTVVGGEVRPAAWRLYTTTRQ